MRKIISTLVLTSGLLLAGAPAIADGPTPVPPGTVTPCDVEVQYWKNMTNDANYANDHLEARVARQHHRIKHLVRAKHRQAREIRRLRAQLADATS